MMPYVKLSALVIALAIFVVCCTTTSNTTPTNTASNANANRTASTPAPTATKDEAAAARDLYSIHCMTCHKDSGKGGPVTVDGKKLNPDDLTSAAMAKKSDEKLAEYIRDGVEDEGMPAFKDKLNETEIATLVKHIRTLQGK